MERPDFFELKNGNKSKLPFSKEEYEKRLSKLMTCSFFAPIVGTTEERRWSRLVVNVMGLRRWVAARRFWTIW